MFRKVVRLVWGVWLIASFVLFVIASFVALSITFNDDLFAQYTDWIWIGWLAFIFLVPFFVADHRNDQGVISHIWLRRFLNAFRRMSIFFTLSAGILWIYPDKTRLEPLLFLFGTLATWTTYLRSQLKDE